MRNPDGAERNPGLPRGVDAAPDFAPLHPGYARLKLSAADAEESRAIAAVAWIACERLDTLRRAWRNLCKCMFGRAQ